MKVDRLKLIKSVCSRRGVDTSLQKHQSAKKSLCKKYYKQFLDINVEAEEVEKTYQKAYSIG